MAKSEKTPNLSAATQNLYKLLTGLGTPENRQKVITAAMTLIGESYTAAGGNGSPGGGAHPPGGAHGGGHAGVQRPAGGAVTARVFFDEKDPKGKIEELAVAARFREEHLGATSHSKDDFRETIKAAKRGFDAKNFRRDLSNAKTAKLFNTGKENTLSYTGERFVDALPDRTAANALRKSKGGRRKGGKRKGA